jgi:Transcriptional regulator
MEPRSTRDKIIDTSMELFARRGYKGTTTKMIAKEAGVNELTIFRIFETKEGILKQGFESRFSIIDEEFKSFKKIAEYDLVPDMKKLAKIFHEKLMDNIYLVLFILHELEEYTSLYELYYQIPVKVKKILIDYFNEMQAAGKMRYMDLETAAITFMVMNVGFIIMKQKFSNNLTSISSTEFIETSIAEYAKSLLA